MKLDDALVGVDRLGLDTPPFIYLIVRTPDALQVATALAAGCAALLTNDARLQRVTELRVLVLDEIEL